LAGRPDDNGTNVPIRAAKTVEEYKAAATAMYGAKAAEFLEMFPAKGDAEVRSQAELVGRMSGFGVQARAQAATGRAPAYFFCWYQRTHWRMITSSKCRPR